MRSFPEINPIRPDTHIQFRYCNWHGDEHTYVIVVEDFEYGPYDRAGLADNPNDKRMVVHGQCLLRDERLRRDMWPWTRRTFLVELMEEVRVIR
jgi:hypothetical protein